MLVFHYDKTFDGLLSAVFDAYTRRSFPDALAGRLDPAPLLATGAIRVDTAMEKSRRVFTGLRKKLSVSGLEVLLHAWLSGESGADMAVFRYIRKVFDAPGSVENDLADPGVFAIVRLARQVRREHHQLEGFTRFQKTAQGIYFAAIAPRHDVLTLLLRHFSERFADQRWLLFDVTRKYGFLFEAGRLREAYLDEALVGELSRNGGRMRADLLEERELLFQLLWKSYFQATAIKERINPRLQSRCMPRRYWPYMTEVQ